MTTISQSSAALVQIRSTLSTIEIQKEIRHLRAKNALKARLHQNKVFV